MNGACGGNPRTVLASAVTMRPRVRRFNPSKGSTGWPARAEVILMSVHALASAGRRDHNEKTRLDGRAKSGLGVRSLARPG
jgi:hypothetical protein